MHDVMRALVLIAILAVAGCPTTRPTEKTTTHAATEKPKKKAKKPKKPKKVAKKPKKVEKKVAAAEEPDDETPEGVVKVIKGRAVWYGADWQGKATASGERFDRHKMTAAHRSLKMGTRVRVTNDNNGKSVVVRINDRGPYGKDKRRIIDVSEAAAKKLDFIDSGWCPVTLEVLGEADDTE